IYLKGTASEAFLLTLNVKTIPLVPELAVPETAISPAPLDALLSQRLVSVPAWIPVGLVMVLLDWFNTVSNSVGPPMFSNCVVVSFNVTKDQRPAICGVCADATVPSNAKLRSAANLRIIVPLF